jgi:PAS domain S-box-containing protein
MTPSVSSQQVSTAWAGGDERLSQLLDATNILPWEADAESWRFTFVGDQAVKLLGHQVEQWYEADFWSANIHPDDREQAIAFCLKNAAACDRYDFEYRMLTTDGRIVWIHDLVNVLRENGKAKILRGFMIDITERKQAEKELRDLGGRLINAQEEERSRIARELHDDLNQQMALLSIELEQLSQKLPPKQSSLRSQIHALWLRAQDISGEIHRLSYQLHPSKLDHLGLAAAVKSICVEMSEHQDLDVEFRQTGFPATLPNDVTLCVFRIAQESLRNVIRHSNATRAQVTLEKTETAVRLSVSDNGCGFDPEADSMKKGLGFISMRERLRLVGGEISIQSQPSQGTQIDVIVPLIVPTVQ